MKTVLEANIPGINVTGTATPEVTGAFEVVDTDTNKVYHTKLGGNGYLDDNMEKIKAVVEAIKADAAGKTE